MQDTAPIVTPYWRANRVSTPLDLSAINTLFMWCTASGVSFWFLLAE
jgi:hypothetical protein